MIPTPFRLGFFPATRDHTAAKELPSYRGADRMYIWPAWDERQKEGGWALQWIGLADALFDKTFNRDLDQAQGLLARLRSIRVNLELIYVEVVHCPYLGSEAEEDATSIAEEWLAVHESVRRPEFATKLGIDIATAFPSIESAIIQPVLPRLDVPYRELLNANGLFSSMEAAMPFLRTAGAFVPDRYYCLLEVWSV